MALDSLTLGLVLLAALSHAGWNALVKADEDRLASLAAMLLASAAVSAPVAVLVARPAPAWGWLALSVAVHLVYCVLLLRAYRYGDLSHVYPIARGLGPLLVAAATGRLIGEHLQFHEAMGVALASLGILSLALVDGVAALALRPTLWAVACGVSIGAFTLIDGVGVRASGRPLGYVAWLNLVEGVLFFSYALQRRRGRLWTYLRASPLRVAGMGIIAAGTYGVVVWAMARGPVAHVAALRETSVLFAALFGSALLGEPFGRRRLAAAGVISGGLVLMNLPLR
jgi:drug/metabolite transporter (DMT)-like permease